jgi:integrase
MSERRSQKKSEKTSVWQPTQYSNLIRYVPSGIYYARFRVRGKLIWKSLKTDRITVAQLRLSDLEKEERKRAETGQLTAKSKVLFESALKAYREKGFRPATPRHKKDAHALKPTAVAYYEQRVKALLASWPELAKTEIRKLTQNDCETWADRARKNMSATVFNHTLGILRNTIDFGVKIGARYDNPANAIMRESEVPKALKLPSAEQFEKFVKAVERDGSGKSRHCADLVRFLAYGGFRIMEAAHVTWADCDFNKKQITLRGPETGLKNRKPGETRVVPMIPDMQALLQRLSAERPKTSLDENVMKVRECQRSMTRAALEVGMSRLTHHDLRHVFATRCIESGVDIPTVSRWLGHRDGGALAMRIYGHLRDHHSSSMALKVSFSANGNSHETPPKGTTSGANSNSR